jgi:hypothetical protein
VGALSFPPPTAATSFQSYFATLARVSDMLKQMAEEERAGTAFTPEQLAFINQAVHQLPGCGSTAFDGWYGQLYFNPESSGEFDPTIADVHTQVTDEFGNVVGHVLHVGTGNARTLVVAVDGCGGVQAYVGLVSSYFEQVTDQFLRLDDPTWAHDVQQDKPGDVRWMKDLVLR